MNTKKITKNLEVKKGDIVKVIAGNSRGERGKVLKVYPETHRVVVEGLNFIKRHVRPTRTDPKGGIQEREAPIHVSNVMVICPNCGHATRIGHHTLEDGSKSRTCGKCHEMLESK